MRTSQALHTCRYLVCLHTIILSLCLPRALLTMLLDGSLELVLRTSNVAPSQAGASVRVDIAPNHIAVWPSVATVS